MGLFSLFSRKKRSREKNAPKDSSVNTTSMPVLEKKWHHTLTEIAVVTHPLGNTPGTSLDRETLFSFIFSMSHAIAELNSEKEDLSSKFYSLGSSIAAKSASEGVSCLKFDVVGLTFEPSLGYSARISAHGKKFTTLFGESTAVARASTPYHEEITALTGADYVLAIDGIAYVALTISSELR